MATRREEAEAAEEKKRAEHDRASRFEGARRGKKLALDLGSHVDALKGDSKHSIGTEHEKAKISAKIGELQISIADRLARDLAWVGRDIAVTIEEAVKAGREVGGKVEAVGTKIEDLESKLEETRSELTGSTNKLKNVIESVSATSTDVAKKMLWVVRLSAVAAFGSMVAAIAAALK